MRIVRVVCFALLNRNVFEVLRHRVHDCLQGAFSGGVLFFFDLFNTLTQVVGYLFGSLIGDFIQTSNAPNGFATTSW